VSLFQSCYHFKRFNQAEHFADLSQLGMKHIGYSAQETIDENFAAECVCKLHRVSDLPDPPRINVFSTLPAILRYNVRP
jgi:hypothetical protein